MVNSNYQHNAVHPLKHIQLEQEVMISLAVFKPATSVSAASSKTQALTSSSDTDAHIDSVPLTTSS